MNEVFRISSINDLIRSPLRRLSGAVFPIGQPPPHGEAHRQSGLDDEDGRKQCTGQQAWKGTEQPTVQQYLGVSVKSEEEPSPSSTVEGVRLSHNASGSRLADYGQTFVQASGLSAPRGLVTANSVQRSLSEHLIQSGLLTFRD